MSVELILRHATTQRWWGLTDGQVRVAFALLSRAASLGSMSVETTGQTIADLCFTSRWSVMRSLAALKLSGFCGVVSDRGGNGSYKIELLLPAHSETATSAHSHDDVIAAKSVDSARRPHIQDSGDPHIQDEPTRTFDSECADETEHPEMVDESLADQGDFGHRKPPDPHIQNSSSAENQGQFASKSSIASRAPDLDLLRSSDLRSSDLEILVDQRRSDPPARLARKSAPIVTRPPKETMDSQPPTAKPSESVTAEPASPHRPKRRTDPSKIPERAWMAADYLRDQILAKNGAAMVGVKPWESGWSWTTGTKARTGDGSRSGLRLSWANSFRLFHESHKIALANGGKPSTDEYAWDEIAKTIVWLFHKQPTGVRFVVECPDTLREKWDRIQVCRTSMRQPGRSMSPPPTGDESACAGRVLSKLGVKAKVSFSSLPQHVELITHQIRSGVSERDLEAVVAYCDDLWRQPEMRKNLRPETLFGANTIARYLDAARTKYARQITSGSEIGGRAVPRSDDDDVHPVHPIMGGMFPE